MISMLFVCLQAVPAIQYSQFQVLSKRQKHSIVIHTYSLLGTLSVILVSTSKKYIGHHHIYVIFSRFECFCENDGSIYSE